MFYGLRKTGNGLKKAQVVQINGLRKLSYDLEQIHCWLLFLLEIFGQLAIH